MPKEVQIDNNSDKLALNAFNLFCGCFLLWVAVWIITIVTTNDGWAIIAGFFIGLVITSLLFIACGFMALTALIGGTRYKVKASITVVTSVGLLVAVVLMYAL